MGPKLDGRAVPVTKLEHGVVTIEREREDHIRPDPFSYLG
jgi:hypothetical protein